MKHLWFVAMAMAVIILAESSLLTVLFVRSELYPSRLELARRRVVLIRTGMMARDLAHLVGLPTTTSPEGQGTSFSTSGLEVWIYRDWPSCAAYVQIDRRGQVTAVRYVPT